MYTIKSTLSFEGSPLEVLRRYAPHLLGTFAGIAIVLLLYEKAFNGGVGMLEETNESMCSVVLTSRTKTNEIIASFY